MRSLGEATARVDGPDSPWRNPSGSVDEIGRSALVHTRTEPRPWERQTKRGSKAWENPGPGCENGVEGPMWGRPPKAARWVTICQNEQRLGLLGLNLGEHGRNRGPMYRTSTYVSEEHMLTRQFCYI